MARKKRRVSVEKKLLAPKMAKIAMEYQPHMIQRELAKNYYKFLKAIEPDYRYVPKDERDNGFEAPSTPLGKFFLRCWLASRNLSIGMEKWAKETR